MYSSSPALCPQVHPDRCFKGSAMPPRCRLSSSTAACPRGRESSAPLWARASLMAQRLKRLTQMQETRVRSLGREDRLEKEMATHSSILAWRISWTEEPGRLRSLGSHRARHDWGDLAQHSTPLFAHFHCTMTIPIWPHEDKKTPLPDVEEELMLEAWFLLKNEEEGGRLSLSTFPLTIKL